MSFDNFAEFIESVPISRVISELRNHRLNSSASDRELQTRLAWVIFWENGIYIPQESDQDREAATSPAKTVRDLGPRTNPGIGSLPVRPPAESMRLNWNVRHLGAVPNDLGPQSLGPTNGAVQRQNRALRTSLPVDLRDPKRGKIIYGDRALPPEMDRFEARRKLF